MNIEQLVFTHRHRVTIEDGAPIGDGATATRQFDAVLMAAGFKCSEALLTTYSNLDPVYVIDQAVRVIAWARELAGDHVQHNVYFIDFPANVPDTLEFWAQCLRDAVAAGATIRAVGGRSQFDNRTLFALDLLSLPAYGRYQHTYQEMLAHHDELLPALSDRLTVIHLGDSLAEEAGELYAQLAGSTVPLSGTDLDALRELGAMFPRMLPEVPVRENKAILNAARVRAGLPPMVDTPTDVLRVAAELSAGDVTLQTVTKFRSLPRRQRRLLAGAIQTMVNDGKLGDIHQYAEQWKRLGERLHPHELAGQFPVMPMAFAVARGELAAPTLASRVEAAFAAGHPETAASMLRGAPGRLWRSADRLLRTSTPTELQQVMGMFEHTAPHVSGRVLLSVREHLQNRGRHADRARIFTNRKGRAWVTGDTRDVIHPAALRELLTTIDLEVASRLPEVKYLVVDPAILGAALPLSGKATPDGLSVFPRGSVTPVTGDSLRFFTYWHEAQRTTDYDLSAVFTDRGWGDDHHVSWTGLSSFEAVHSGDITSSHNGATEFIDVNLARASGIILPQLYIYSGEGFDEVTENFFGWMTRDALQAGRPFEARTVRTKSALFGDSRTAMPMVFYRGDDGRWYAKWLHLYLKGRSWGGRVEENKLTSKLLARTITERSYLRIAYLVDAWKEQGTEVITWSPDGFHSKLIPEGEPVTYIGAEQPEGLPGGSQIITLSNLGALIPA